VQAYSKLLLPFNFGLAFIVQDFLLHPSMDLPHSYDGFGKTLIWYPSSDIKKLKKACDLENEIRATEYMSLYFNMKSPYFLANWVCNEVLAKLFDIPILLWIKKYKIIEFINADIKYELFRFAMNSNIAEFIYVKCASLNLHLSFGVIVK